MRVITQELQDEPVAERAVIMAAGHPAVQAARVKYMRARQIPDLVLFLYHVQTDGAAKNNQRWPHPLRVDHLPHCVVKDMR